MIFGLFEKKEAKLIRADLVTTFEQADTNFPLKIKKNIAKNVLNRIFTSIKEIDGIPHGTDLDNIIKRQLEDVQYERRSNVNELQWSNPKWMEVALHESYLLMNCGKFGKKLAKEAILVIYWCRKNLSEKEINSIVKKAKITKEKIFG